MNATGTRPVGRRLRAALAASALVITTAPLLAAGPPAAAQSAARPGFVKVGTLPITDPDHSADPTQTITTAEGALIVDADHRRAYQYWTLTNPNRTRFHVFDLDSLENGQYQRLAPIEIGDQGLSSACTAFPVPEPECPDDLQNFDQDRMLVESTIREPLVVADPATGRLVYSGKGAFPGLYEIADYDPATGDHTLNKWTGEPNPGLGSFPSNTLRPSAYGMWFDPGDPSIPGAQDATIYMTGVARVSGGALGSRDSYVWIAAFDARHDPGQTTPQDRQKWLYVTRTCRGMASAANRVAVFRAGSWLYTTCDASTDGSARGVYRVRLEHNPATDSVEPNPAAEQFFPGITGSDVETFADPATERLYVLSQNVTAGSRDVLVFDGRVADGAGGYIGEIALSQSTQPPTAGVDPASGRWYFRSAEGLWFQDGRLKRLAQANLFKRDLSGNPFPSTGTSRRLYVDPAVVDTSDPRQPVATRPSRVFVHRGDRYDVYEQRAALPGTPPPPDERTLNVPEGPGKAGVYSAVATAYGVRVRVMRGLSTLWPTSVGPQITESPPTNNPPHPSQPFDYIRDPFFYDQGECGSKDREVAFGRILETTLAGGLFNKDASARALAVDPEVHRPSAPDETRTRDDVANPDRCIRSLVQYMTDGFHCTDPDDRSTCEGEMPHGLEQFGQAWPYQTVTCAGDGADEHSTSSPGSQDERLVPASGAADVRCDATGSPASSGARAQTMLSPASGQNEHGFAVGEVETTTSVTRRAEGGIVVESRAVVRDLRIGPVVLDLLEVVATAEAAGYADKDGTTAKISTARRFRGLTVGALPVCGDDCHEGQVLEALNAALGPNGYVRMAEPESDYTLGTVKGTLAVVQKDLLLQDADATTNRDESAEWAGLEIGMYRDGVQRGRGRWVVQLGGVFAQAQFGVVSELSKLPDPDPEPDPEPDDDGVPVVLGSDTSNAGDAVPGTPASFVEVLQPAAAGREAEASPGFWEELRRRVREGLARSVTAALLMGALWTLVFGPVYVARRRALLKQVTVS